MKNEKLMIFTPTYNRAYCLPRIYNSLVNQSDKKFVWLIVDDGSTDSTEKIVEKWIKENLINIKYYKQENQGKMQAYNKALINCDNELFLCLDSDDWLHEDAVKEILETYDNIKNNDKCVGMVSYRVYEDFTPVGGKELPKNVKFSTLMNLYAKYKFRGDTMLVFKSKIAKKYMFPKIENEKFIQESYIYDQIDQEGELYILNKKLYFCEYMQDGYSNNIAKVIAKNPKGYILFAKQRIKLACCLKYKFIACAKYVLGSLLDGNKHYLKGMDNKLLIILAIPLAKIMYLKKYNNIEEKV